MTIMELTGNDKVAELFLRIAKELRAMGATRVEGLGFVANFGPAPAERAPVAAGDGTPERALSAEARELQARAQKWAGGER